MGPLETAHVIGRRVCDDAVWHAGSCSWMGATPSPTGTLMAPPATTAALGPDLYSGTAGVGLFLAYLHALTGDPASLRTARGALHHALGAVEMVPAGRRLSLFTGTLGITLCAARAGRVIGDEDVAATASRIAATLNEPGVSGHDLISGAAGAICGFLALATELEDARYAERAHEIARGLLAGPCRLSLSGMAHGHAGVVHALLEIDAGGSNAPVIAAAARAAEHEGRLFDSRTGNWSDLREMTARELGDVGATSAMAWCHGAPGVLLSRRSAAGRLGPEEDRRKEAAARCVERWVRAALNTRPGNLSLCHGLTGNAECLWDGTGSLAARGLAEDVAALAWEEYGRTGAAWPCGTPAGETPSLMLGLAGVGLFHLRLEDPSIPSALAPGAGVLRR